MVFTTADAWYVMLFKFALLVLATGLGANLIKLSLWNLCQRIGMIKTSARHKTLYRLFGHGCVLVLNLLFIWILLQAIVVLVAGYLGVPALALLKGHLKLYAMVGEVILAVLYIANGKRLNSKRSANK